MDKEVEDYLDEIFKPKKPRRKVMALISHPDVGWVDLSGNQASGHKRIDDVSEEVQRDLLGGHTLGEWLMKHSSK